MPTARLIRVLAGGIELIGPVLGDVDIVIRKFGTLVVERALLCHHLLEVRDHDLVTHRAFVGLVQDGGVLNLEDTILRDVQAITP